MSESRNDGVADEDAAREAELTGSQARDPRRRRLESEFLLAMRRAGSVMQLLGAASAESIGINVTDLNCINILALTGRMTAGDLARVSGLTTASITGVIDRLEEAGFVHRERDPSDRRRVVISLDPARGLREIAPVFAPVVAAWRDAVAQYTDEQLGLLLDFQHQLEEIMRGRLVELRGGEATRAAGDRTAP